MTFTHYGNFDGWNGSNIHGNSGEMNQHFKWAYWNKSFKQTSCAYNGLSLLIVQFSKGTVYPIWVIFAPLLPFVDPLYFLLMVDTKFFWSPPSIWIIAFLTNFDWRINITSPPPPNRQVESKQAGTFEKSG